MLPSDPSSWATEPLAVSEQRCQRDERNGGKVLEQEHGEAHAPVTRRKIALSPP